MLWLTACGYKGNDELYKELHSYDENSEMHSGAISTFAKKHNLPNEFIINFSKINFASHIGAEFTSLSSCCAHTKENRRIS